MDGGRLDAKSLRSAADDHLNKLFKIGKPVASGTSWIADVVSNMVYLDRGRISRRGLKVEQVAEALAGWLVKQSGVQTAYTQKQLLSSAKDDQIAEKVRRSFRAEESGDVMLVPKSGWYFWSRGGGTTHGSPHDYDRWVPLIVYGPRIEKGVRKELVSPEAAAPILAEALGIKPPSGARVGVPEGLFAARDQ
jgi:hypothetical protein